MLCLCGRETLLTSRLLRPALIEAETGKLTGQP